MIIKHGKYSKICENFPECGDIEDIKYQVGECNHCLHESGFFDIDIDHEREMMDMDYDNTPCYSEYPDIPYAN